MQYKIGTDLHWIDLKLGDTVIGSDGKLVDMIALNCGYIISTGPGSDLQAVYHLQAVYQYDHLYEKENKIYLSKNEIKAMYEYAFKEKSQHE